MLINNAVRESIMTILNTIVELRNDVASLKLRVEELSQLPPPRCRCPCDDEEQ